MATKHLQQFGTEDHKLKRHLGFWSLLAAGVGSVIGSGWLFAAMYGAQAAGPAVLVAWIIGGLLMLAIALVFAELGMVRPESGGLVRYPLYANGRLVATIVGWTMWLSYVGNPPSEASATVQYASAWVPKGLLYDGEKLTFAGILVAIALMAVLVLVNWFGVSLFAKANNTVTAIKVCIPIVTVGLLIASGFTHHQGAGGADNFTAHGLAPAGWGAALGAIATAGMIFAYTGFRNIIELSGEARRPRKDIPRALVATIAFTVVLYLGLQVAFIMGVQQRLLGHGWQGVNFDSPFADLAKLLGITWLSWLLIADSMVSPAGSGIVYTGSNARNVFGLSKSGLLPRFMGLVNERTGIPARALVFNFVIGVLFLLPLPSWQSIVEVMSTLAVFTFSIGSVAVMTFRRVGLGNSGTRLAAMPVLAPVAFVVSALVMLWAPWSTLSKTIPITGLALLWFIGSHLKSGFERADIAGGGWMVVHLVFVYAVSFMGSFEGKGWIPGPWDSLIVAVGSLAIYFWAVSSGKTYMRHHPEVVEEIQRGTEHHDAEHATQAP